MRGWIRATLFLTVFSAMLGSGLVSPLMAIYARDLGATGIFLGLIFGSFSFARLFVNPVAGRLSDIKGRKRIMIFGMVAYSVTSLAYLLANTTFLLALVRFLHGAASAMIVPVAMAYAADLVPKGKEGRGLVPFNTATSLGFAGGPLLGGALTERFGMASAFLAMFILSILALILVVLGLPEVARKIRTPTSAKFGSSISRPMAGLMLFRSIMPFTWGALFTLLAVYAETIGVSLASVGLILTVSVLSLSAFQLVVGRLVDRYDRVWLGAVGGLVSIGSIFFIPMSKDFGGLLFLHIFLGLGTAVQMAVSLALATELGRERGLGSTFGFLDSGMAVGGIAGPLFIGVVFDLLGFDRAFFLDSVVGVVGIAGFVAILKTSREITELKIKRVAEGTLT